MKFAFYNNIWGKIVLSGITITCMITGCHSPDDDITEFGYPSFEPQKLQRGELLLKAKDSQQALAMKQVQYQKVKFLLC